MSQGLVMFTKNADVSGPEPAYYLLCVMCKAHSKVTHIKQQKYFHHLNGRGYNTQSLLYPRPTIFGRVVISICPWCIFPPKLIWSKYLHKIRKHYISQISIWRPPPSWIFTVSEFSMFRHDTYSSVVRELCTVSVTFLLLKYAYKPLHLNWGIWRKGISLTETTHFERTVNCYYHGILCAWRRIQKNCHIASFRVFAQTTHVAPRWKPNLACKVIPWM